MILYIRMEMLLRGFLYVTKRRVCTLHYELRYERKDLGLVYASVPQVLMKYMRIQPFHIDT